MYGRSDLYGSTFVAQVLSPDRFERLSRSVADELFGPDDMDEIDGVDEDDMYGDVEGVPAFLRSKVASWSRRSTLPPVPPSLPSSQPSRMTLSAHPVALQMSDALSGYLVSRPYLEGNTLHVQVQGQAWPKVLQTAAKVARSGGFGLQVLISDTDLPMQGSVPLTLELVSYGR